MVYNILYNHIEKESRKSSSYVSKVMKKVLFLRKNVDELKILSTK